VRSTTRPGTDLTAPLTDPAFFAGDPHPLYARLRTEAPLAWNDDLGFWAASRYDDVVAISKDPDRFCSRKGILLMDLGRELPEIPGALLYVDPPEHQRYRRLVQPAFTPSRMRAIETMVRARTVALLDGFDTGEVVDIVPELAVLLPLYVIADLLGVPADDWPSFNRWSERLIAAATAQDDETIAAGVEMAEYFLAVIADKQAHPADDLVSLLGAAEIDGERLDDGELMMFCGQLLVAGNETSRDLVAGGLVALAEHPDQLRRLVDDPSLVPVAVEELLRWTSPVTSFMRTATRDTELAGTAIAAGEPVLLLYASANRDESVFGPTADRLDVGRQPNHHVAFGFGEHFCLGAALARLEGRVLFEELLARFSTIEPAGAVERLASGVVAGVLTAPLRFAA
jgi:cytochrome P450